MICSPLFRGLRYSQREGAWRCRFAAACAALLLVVPTAAATERGLLWKLDREGGLTSYLFGTIHADDARVTEFSPVLRDALRQVDAFMLEILPVRDMAPLVMREGDLRDHLKTEEVAQVLRLADEHALREDLALRMKPWLLSALFSLPRAQSPFTQDIRLYGLARDEGKETHALETAAEHFGSLDDLPLADQLHLLRATLDAGQTQKESQYEAMLKAYLTRDTDRIADENARALREGLPERLGMEVKRRLLDVRNARMADRILELAGRQAVLVAVGAAHLPGEDGLIARLRSAGYRVTPME